MPDMTDTKEIPLDKEHLLDDLTATVGDASWFPETSQLVTGKITLPEIVKVKENVLNLKHDFVHLDPFNKQFAI